MLQSWGPKFDSLRATKSVVMHLPDAMVAFLAQVWSLKIIWHCDPVNCHGCGCPQFIHPASKRFVTCILPSRLFSLHLAKSKFRAFKGCLVTLKLSCPHGLFALVRGCRHVVLMRSLVQRCGSLPKMTLFLPCERKALQTRPFSNWSLKRRIGDLPTWTSHWIWPP